MNAPHVWQPREDEDRALILAPFGRDGAVAAGILSEAGLRACAYATLEYLVAALEMGAGCIVITQEALQTSDLNPLFGWLGGQPPWSDLPIIIITEHGGGPESNPGALRFMEALGNVTFLERPFRALTLVSVVQSAVRSRRRQFQAREHLAELSHRQAALVDSEARLRLATEAGQVGVFDWNLDSGELRWDDRLRELWALPPGAGVSIETFYAGLHPDDLPRVSAVVAASLHPSGDGVYETEYRIIGIADEKERHIIAKGRVSFEHGRAVRMIGTGVEVTELRQAQAVLARDKAELERLVEARTSDLQETQAHLAHAQRMEALGQLAGGIAHDFNNVLQAVQGALGLIERHLNDPDRLRRLARLIADAAGRGAAITRRLLVFSRQGDLRTEAVDPEDLLAGMQEILGHTLGAGIEVRAEAPDGPPRLLADKAQLETVLVNLATNARDAMPHGGVLTLSASLAVVEPGRGPHPRIELTPGRYVRLSVGDTGTGMPPEVLARATEPFFTTKRDGNGTGLGLPMAKGFAEQSGGGFLIESAPGRGTTVSLWLPVAADPVTDAAPAETHSGSSVGRGP